MEGLVILDYDVFLGDRVLSNTLNSMRHERTR